MATRKRGPKTTSDGAFTREMLEAERAILVKYLKKNNGHVTNTARELGLSSRALHGKLAAHDLQSLASDLRATAGISGHR